eukprot:1156772-Pelagomonas_calceolata.AAC.11
MESKLYYTGNVQRVGKYGASPIAHAPPSRGLAAGSDAADHISSTTTSPPHAVSAVGSRRSTAGSPPTGAPGGEHCVSPEQLCAGDVMAVVL